MFAIPFPNIDPVIVQVGPVAVRWYALAYIIGIMMGIGIMKRMNRCYVPEITTKSILDDLVVWVVLGIVMGGRLGYVLFYGLDQAIGNPVWIMQTWRGGMSFHGGVLGLSMAIWLYCRRHKINFMQMADISACVAPIGLFLGRIANFINGELYGKITDVPWAMVFPDGGPYPRHPSQLYEAGLEGVVLGVIMLNIFFYTRLKQQPGKLTGVFLLGYAIFRMIVENYRQPDEPIGMIWGILSMGQLLSAPMVVVGIYLLLREAKNAKKHD